MKRRYFIGSTGILTAGLLNLNLFSRSEQVPKSLQSLMIKFDKELNTSLTSHNAPHFKSGLTTIQTVLGQSALEGHSYFYYKSKSNDRILLLNKNDRDLIFINPDYPEKYFALA